MVGGDIEQDGDVGAEVVHIVQLEGGKLHYVPLVWRLGHLQRLAVPDVAGQAYIESGFLQDVVNERGRSRLAIAPRDTDGAGCAEVTSGKFYLAQYRCAFAAQGLDGRSRVGDAGALDDDVGLGQPRLRVSSFLVGQAARF